MTVIWLVDIVMRTPEPIIPRNQVTISLDGPNDINDKLRTYENGSGTSAIVKDNLRNILKHIDFPVMIESTYTKLHYEYNIYISDIIRYFFDEFGIKNIHVAPAVGSFSPDSVLSIKSDISQIFKNATRGYPYPTMITNKFLILKNKKSTTQLCDAGMGTYAVTVDGDTYPCFMLSGQSSLFMGNVNDRNLFESESFHKIQEELSSFNKFTDSKCKDCFANTACTGCIGKNYIDGDDIYTPSRINCTYEKALLEETLLELIIKSLK